MVTAIEVLALFVLACIAIATIGAAVLWLIELADELIAGRKRGQW